MTKDDLIFSKNASKAQMQTIRHMVESFEADLEYGYVLLSIGSEPKGIDSCFSIEKFRLNIAKVKE